MLLDIILRLMTTASVFVGAAAVYATNHNQTRQINTQIFLAYSDRLQSIRRAMRSDLLSMRTSELDLGVDVEIPVGAMETLHLIFELFELREQGYVRATVWNVWRRDIDRFLLAPLIRQGHAQVAIEFEGHHKFIDWMQQRQETLKSVDFASARDPKARGERHGRAWKN